MEQNIQQESRQKVSFSLKKIIALILILVGGAIILPGAFLYVGTFYESMHSSDAAWGYALVMPLLLVGVPLFFFGTFLFLIKKIMASFLFTIIFSMFLFFLLYRLAGFR
jgi:hypothetical protein